MLNIKFAQLPGPVSDYVLEDGATVSDLLEVANASTDGYTVTVDGAAASTDTVLQNGQNVILSKAAKGNH